MFEQRTIQLVTEDERHPPVQPPAPKELKNKLFSFVGRIDRLNYTAIMVGYFFAIVGCYVFMASMGDSVVGAILLLIISFGMIWSMLAVLAKRLHDRNLSGWWQVLTIIPIVGYIMPFVLMVMPGTKGVNDYGQPP